MITQCTLLLPADKADSIELQKQYLQKQYRILPDEITAIEILKKSIDARAKEVKIHLQLNVYTFPDLYIPFQAIPLPILPDNAPIVLVCGCGPAGLFAALELVRNGIKPVILERGKNIHTRKKDIALLYKEQILVKDSNYAFGEGGAGTFSDGKLFTRSDKRGNTTDILRAFVYYGASPSILQEAHPHIGSDVLPRVVENIRNALIQAGAEVFFQTKVVDFLIENKIIKGLKTENGKEYNAKAVILATGSSARDIYEWFFEHNYAISPKAFAMGVRLEHPQKEIDRIRYKTNSRPAYLPPAEYAFAEQIKGRGVFSFCMCPGGMIIPALTEENTIVVNGMSNSQRNSSFANAGLVVEVKESDYFAFSDFGPLAGLRFRQNYEQGMFAFSPRGLEAPAQRMIDFAKDRNSINLPESSYLPGLYSAPLKELLPPFVSEALKGVCRTLDEKRKGFYSENALLLGLESRTSSPVQIDRDRTSLEHTQIKNLYPCGEGAGYAGGITSSAMDGIRCAQKLSEKVKDIK